MLQEVALGGTQSPMLCGDHTVTWEELYRATYSFGKHNIDTMFSLIDQEYRAAGIEATGLKRNKLIHLNEEQAVQAGKKVAGHFICMLDLGRKSLVTDPRDKVYGLLGLTESNIAEHIVPDYNSTPTEVFTAFAKAMIGHRFVRTTIRIEAKVIDLCEPQSGLKLTLIVKLIALKFSNNAPAQQLVCHPGSPTGQKRIIFACLVVDLHIKLLGAVELSSISLITINTSHAKG